MGSAVAAIQCCITHSLEENLKNIDHQVKKAKQLGAQLALLPEHAAMGASANHGFLHFVESLGAGPVQDSIAFIAKKYAIWLVLGAFPIRMEDGKVYSCSLLYNSEGQLLEYYGKMHLFDVNIDQQFVSNESSDFSPGNRVVIVDTPIGRVGLTICYDLRFPELFRALAQQGVDVFLVPAAFMAHTGQAHWEVLLRARAIENTAYVVAANQYGVLPNGHQAYGHSMIIDPWGVVLDQQASGDGVVFAHVDLSYLQTIRRQLPALQHIVL